MKMAYAKPILLASALLSTSVMAQPPKQTQQQPTGWLWGIGLSYQQEIYQDVDDEFRPIPIIGYKGERLQVYGPFVSYDLVQTDDFSFSIKAQPRFNDYESSDSDFLVGMDDRDMSLDVGAGFSWEVADFKLSTGALFDVLDKSGGHELDFSIGYQFQYGPFFFEPSVAVVYQDEKLVDYYYGVQSHEAMDFRPAYQGDSAVNQELNFSFFTPAWFGGITRLELSYTLYDDVISDSPIVEDDSNLGLMLFYSRFF
ncbi:MipA/OmpV family protein [Catenovulum sp. SM1970]|uniref:MipA/OmpV family protein n=1 Tax=Marinifaba aquimaris TaxID=2741323 RepID=UPI00157180C9|nr:MipA/OmpV family protein [Marinifaba aquimaris]NTS75810.1 MipA/OmpV family protein [Marinifaba aquimaris]